MEKKKELVKQIRYGRQKVYVKGGIIFNGSALYKKHKNVAKQIRRKVYDKQILSPPIPNVRGELFDSPKTEDVTITSQGVKITINDIPAIARCLVLTVANEEGDYRSGNTKIENVHYIKRDKLNNGIYHYELKDNNTIDTYKYMSILYLDENRLASSMTLYKKE